MGWVKSGSSSVGTGSARGGAGGGLERTAPLTAGVEHSRVLPAAPPGMHLQHGRQDAPPAHKLGSVAAVPGCLSDRCASVS